MLLLPPLNARVKVQKGQLTSSSHIARRPRLEQSICPCSLRLVACIFVTSLSLLCPDSAFTVGDTLTEVPEGATLLALAGSTGEEGQEVSL